MLTARALDGLPEIAAGDDLAALIAASLPGDAPLRDGDVVVIAHKAVSKAEGRVRRLAEVSPGPRAVELAAAHAKDARHVQVVLDETSELLRADAARGVLICVTRHGFVCANAGVDASNAAADGPETLILLPVDPDGSARALRARLRELTGAAPAVVITDSFGRAWRHGQVDVAIGAAGLAPLEDWRGRTDSVGRELRATWIALADEVAAAADLARGKDSRQPVVVVGGLERHVLPHGDDGPGAAALLRDASEDLFR
jgi:coenzyme F420-0:L-glutamate ligase/coenzyme F420-1:gamma-L-glutamate ligase